MRTVLHRWIWSRLPRRMRRSALFAVTGLAARGPDPDARPAEPIIVVGCLRSATGSGEAARLCYETLGAGGFDVRAIDMSALLMQPEDFPAYPFRDGRSAWGRGTLLVHVNAPLMAMALLSLGGRMVRDKWVVGCWAWELQAVPPEWVPGARLVHEIWTPSRFVAEAVAARITGVPIRVLAHPVAGTPTRAQESAPRTAPGPFTALVVFNMGSSMERKNPIAAVKAFQDAFERRSDARLIVKVTNAGLFPDGERRLRVAAGAAGDVTLIERTLQPRELSELYRDAGCLISLHRSEGFGLAVAEAMTRGVPVLSTDWSGTTDFVTTDTGRPVPYRLVPAHDPQRTYEDPDQSWAEADQAAASSMLCALRENAAGLGERAREDALRRFGTNAYVSAVETFLGFSRRAPGRGDQSPAEA